MKKLFIYSMVLMMVALTQSALGTPVLFPLNQMFGGHSYQKSFQLQAAETFVTDGTNSWIGSSQNVVPSGGTNPIVELTPNMYLVVFPDAKYPWRIRVPNSTNLQNAISISTGPLPTFLLTPSVPITVGAGIVVATNLDGSITLSIDPNLSSINATNAHFNQIYSRDNFGNNYLRINSNGDFLDVFGNVIVGAGGALHYQVVGGGTSLLTDGSGSLYYPSGKLMSDTNGGLHYGHAALPDYVFQIVSPPAGDGSDPAGEIFLYYPPQFSGSGPTFTQTPMVDATGLRYPVPNAGGNLADAYGNIDAAFTGQAFLSGDGTVYWPELINHKHMTTTGDILSMSGKQIATTNGFIVFQTNSISFWPIAPLHRGDQMLVNSNGTMYWLKSGANGNTWISTNLAN